MDKDKDAGFADPAGTWNQRFAIDGFLFGTEPNEWLREHAGAQLAREVRAHVDPVRE